MGILSASNTTELETIQIHHRERQVVGHGDRANFIDIPDYAVVDGVAVTVPVSFDYAPADADMGNWKLTSIIKPYLVKGGLVTNSRTAFVVFPPGANNITYQPVLGFGRGPVVPIDPVEEEELLEAEQAQMDRLHTQTIIIVSSSVGGVLVLTCLAVIWFMVWTKKRKQPKVEDINTDPQTAQQEQDKLIITQNPSSYQTLP